MAGRKDSQEGPGEHHGAAAGGAKPSLVHHRSVRDSSKTMDEALREAEELAESRQKSFARSMAPVKRGPSIPEFVWRAATQTPATGGVQRDAPGTIFPMPSRQERLAAAEAKLRAKREQEEREQAELFAWEEQQRLLARQAAHASTTTAASTTIRSHASSTTAAHSTASGAPHHVVLTVPVHKQVYPDPLASDADLIQAERDLMRAHEQLVQQNQRLQLELWKTQEVYEQRKVAHLLSGRASSSTATSPSAKPSASQPAPRAAAPHGAGEQPAATGGGAAAAAAPVAAPTAEELAAVEASLAQLREEQARLQQQHQALLERHQHLVSLQQQQQQQHGGGRRASQAGAGMDSLTHRFSRLSQQGSPSTTTTTARSHLALPDTLLVSQYSMPDAPISPTPKQRQAFCLDSPAGPARPRTSSTSGVPGTTAAGALIPTAALPQFANSGGIPPRPPSNSGTPSRLALWPGPAAAASAPPPTAAGRSHRQSEPGGGATSRLAWAGAPTPPPGSQPLMPKRSMTLSGGAAAFTLAARAARGESTSGAAGEPAAEGEPAPHATAAALIPTSPAQPAAPLATAAATAEPDASSLTISAFSSPALSHETRPVTPRLFASGPVLLSGLATTPQPPQPESSVPEQLLDGVAAAAAAADGARVTRRRLAARVKSARTLSTRTSISLAQGIAPSSSAQHPPRRSVGGARGLTPQEEEEEEAGEDGGASYGTRSSRGLSDGDGSVAGDPPPAEPEPAAAQQQQWAGPRRDALEECGAAERLSAQALAKLNSTWVPSSALATAATQAAASSRSSERHQEWLQQVQQQQQQQPSAATAALRAAAGGPGGRFAHLALRASLPGTATASLTSPTPSSGAAAAAAAAVATSPHGPRLSLSGAGSTAAAAPSTSNLWAQVMTGRRTLGHALSEADDDRSSDKGSDSHSAVERGSTASLQRRSRLDSPRGSGFGRSSLVHASGPAVAAATPGFGVQAGGAGGATTLVGWSSGGLGGGAGTVAAAVGTPAVAAAPAAGLAARLSLGAPKPLRSLALDLLSNRS